MQQNTVTSAWFKSIVCCFVYTVLLNKTFHLRVTVLCDYSPLNVSFCIVELKNDLCFTLALQQMVCQYKESVNWHENKRSFLSGEQVSLAALYTEPVIIQKNKKGNFRKINVMELFRLHNPTIILQGNSGSGKSFIAQKIMLDWASEKNDLKEFDLTFYLRYEEVKCISEEMNLIELLSLNCSLSSHQISQMFLNSAQRVLFIIDGLDDLDDLRFIYHEFCISSPFQRVPAEIIICFLL